MSSAAMMYPAPGQLAVSGTHPVAAATAVQGGAGVSPVGGATTTSASAAGSSVQGTGAGVVSKPGKLVAFEGFLKRAGHIAGVVLTDILKYVIPVASIVSVADPAAAPAIEAFTASVKLVQATVISVQQKWSAQGADANAQKLADVLEIVEQPVLTMFAQAGIQVDTAYVTNLVNGVVAILNAQPGAAIPAAA